MRITYTVIEQWDTLGTLRGQVSQVSQRKMLIRGRPSLMDTQTCELVSQKCPTEGIGSGDILRKYLFLLVRPAGIEPATNGLEGRCSIH